MTVAFATPYRCININIVECKFYFTSSIWLSTVSVLIETLWNVNSFYSSPNNVGSSVLIETLWNVNYEMGKQNILLVCVLIETLWNVNVHVGRR